MTPAGTLTAPRTAHPIEHFARSHHRALERWLRRHFGRQLTAEDVSDVLSETYRAALETEETRAFEAERMSAWSYQVARYRAIAVLRERHGRSARPAEGDEPRASSRRVILSLDQITGVDKRIAAADHAIDDGPGGAATAGPASDSAYAQLCDEMRAEEVRHVTNALLRLPADQREALQHVHIDGLSVRAAAELLGTSKSTFSRIYQRALQRLQSLCAAEQGADCAHARALLASKTALAPELLGRRDAHIEGCFACQVAAGRRVRIVLPALPVIAFSVPGGIGRLLDRFARVGALVSRSGGLPDEAVAAGVTTAGGGAIAGSSVLGGIAVKAAACAVAACTAVAAVPVVAKHPAKTAGMPQPAEPSAMPTPVLANASTSTTTPQRERAAQAAAARRASAKARRKAAPAARRRKAANARKNDTAQEFSPESLAARPAAGSSAPSASASSSPLAASASTETAPRTSAPSKSSSRSGSSFSEEFRP